MLPLILLLSPVAAQEKTLTRKAVVATVVQNAKAFLDTLSDVDVAQVLFQFDDDKQRVRWSNLPVTMVKRSGLRWGDLSKKQRGALHKVFKTALSKEGFQQIVDNMDGDEVLRRKGSDMFGRDEYFVSFMGEPSTSKPWMLQFGGHHLAINITVVGENMTFAPSLTGGQPMDYELDGRKVRQLADEEDRAFEFIGSLTNEQTKKVVLADRYADMIWGPGREGAKPMKQGVPGSELSKPQRALLLKLIGDRIGVLNKVHAAERMKRIEKDLDQTWFAWFGPIKPGSSATFRIQGPTILMEFAPQRLGGKPMDHIHAMYRDPTNDYGAGFLAER